MTQAQLQELDNWLDSRLWSEGIRNQDPRLTWRRPTLLPSDAWGVVERMFDRGWEPAITAASKNEGKQWQVSFVKDSKNYFAYNPSFPLAVSLAAKGALEKEDTP